MSKKLLGIIEAVLENPARSSLREAFCRQAAGAEYTAARKALKYLRRVLCGGTELQQTTAFDLVRAALKTGNEELRTQAAERVLPELLELVRSSQLSPPFLQTILAGVQSWAQQYPESLFEEVFLYLQAQGFVFGQEDTTQRCFHLIGKVTKAMTSANANEAKRCLKQAERVLRQVNKHVPQYKQLCKAFSQCYRQYTEWKDEPLPKTLPRSTSVDSMEAAEELSLRCESNEVTASFTRLPPAEEESSNFRLKEKLAEYEDLAGLYKRDLQAIQAQFLEVIDSRDSLNAQLTELQTTHKELTERIKDSSSKLGRLRTMRQRLSDDAITFNTKAASSRELIARLEATIELRQQEDEQAKDRLRWLATTSSVAGEGELFARSGQLYSDALLSVDFRLTAEKQVVQVHLAVSSHLVDGFNASFICLPEGLKELSGFQSDSSREATAQLEISGCPVEPPRLLLTARIGKEECSYLLALPHMLFAGFVCSSQDYVQTWCSLASSATTFVLPGCSVDQLTQALQVCCASEIANEVSAFLHAEFDGLPLVWKLSKTEEELVVEVRCSSDEVRNAVVQILSKL